MEALNSEIFSCAAGAAGAVAEAAELNVVRAVVLVRNETLLGGVAISVNVPISHRMQTKYTLI